VVRMLVNHTWSGLGVSNVQDCIVLRTIDLDNLFSNQCGFSSCWGKYTMRMVKGGQDCPVAEIVYILTSVNATRRWKNILERDLYKVRAETVCFILRGLVVHCIQIGSTVLVGSRTTIRKICERGAIVV